MWAKRLLASLLALALLGPPGAGPALAEDPAPSRALEHAATQSSSAVTAQAPEPSESERDIGDAIGFRYASAALVEPEQQGPPAPSSLFAGFDGSTPMERMLNAAKAAQRDLDRTCADLRRKYSSKDLACELSLVNQECKARARILGARVDLLRKLHQGGDRRTFFTRLASRVSRDLSTAWYRIGPVGRRILRPIGDEIRDAVMSGAIPEAGVLRRFVKRSLVRGAKRELARIVDQGIDRVIGGPGTGQGVCDEESEQPTKTGWTAGTGIVTVEGVFGRGQAGAGMTWDHFLGPQCTYYQAYNPDINDPELPGLRVRLTFDLDAGTFSGTIDGRTYGEEFLWEAWGDFRLAIFDGTISRELDAWDWDLVGRGGVSLRYRMNGQCVAEGGNEPASRSGSSGGVVDIAGRVVLVNDRWLLEARALRQIDDQQFSLSLRDIEVGRWDPIGEG